MKAKGLIFYNPVKLLIWTLGLIAAGYSQAEKTADFVVSNNPFTIKSGWQMQESAKVPQTGAELSVSGFPTTGWYSATVPGTVLTTLVNNGVYPEPLYGENNRPDRIPESLCRTSYWYRTAVTIPQSYSGKTTWLNFAGINYAAQVWVNGKKMGDIKGAFIRGVFDISSVVVPGKEATIAVLIFPQPTPGESHEHTLSEGMGQNGGDTSLDGPTFLCSIGWDWIPAIRDRNTGIWQKVFLSATGNVLIQNPLVTTDLPLPETDSADVSIQATLKNLTDQPQKGVLKGTFGGISFQKNIELQAHAAQTVKMDSKEFPQFHLTDPTLWWPNGYGPQNLYALQLSVEVDGVVSDFKNFNFGVREYSYSVPDSENLTLSVNGVKVLCKGGNWGMDEAMKRIPRERLEAQIRMHQIANYNMIRNWVGQSTSEDFYELCDKYGIMLWDEFFQPNPNDGPNPKDLNTYIANVRDKILRFRNHPSIAVWCARNEGHPPKEINDKLRTLMAELEPTRLYQSSSSDGRGVHSSGPYFWRRPAEYYKFSAPFKTEIGSVSIPTLESVQGMMPRKDWESINDDWAEHDLAKGAQQRRTLYSDDINNRYGKAVNLADFVRKAQLANYEAFRAMYEGRNAKLFNPCTGILTWMSNPAQPSFVWQLYHHDLEPNSSLFATRKACEPVHIQLNEKEWQVEVINNLPTALENARAHIDIYNLDSSLAYTHDFDVTARPCTVTNLGKVEWPEKLSSVHFIRLRLYAGIGELISDNFYWREFPVHKDELKDLNKLPVVTLDVKAKRRDADGKCFLDVTVNNPSSQIALMAHLQLHRQRSNDRVLPVYYTDNYISLVPNESKTITIEAALSDLKGEIPLILVDGWNIGVKAASFDQVAVGLNENTQVSHWPITNISIAKTFGLEL